MSRDTIIEILNRFKNGKISDDEVLDYIEKLPYEDISFARIDHHRALRWGFPEVIYCPGKTPQQVREIAKKITDRGYNLLATRASQIVFDAVKESLPEAQYNKTGKTITYIKNDIKKIEGRVTIVTAGTSDIPIGNETLETGNILGLDTSIIIDIGVAGIHRVMDHKDELDSSSVIIVIAGMEGALASVIAGMVSSPVIAVPTSTGYGAAFNGLTPLLGMLTSCVPGVAVMNIDNGFGAAFLAFRILNTLNKLETSR
ncbi:MAG: nickel pincer cofactor biosynthesis protein LarB [Spirochaetota bacterium]|nr:nickel pincer cofactor biosynthesis protein LarB [Spirochaetota bacterium]